VQHSTLSVNPVTGPWKAKIEGMAELPSAQRKEENNNRDDDATATMNQAAGGHFPHHSDFVFV